MAVLECGIQQGVLFPRFGCGVGVLTFCAAFQRLARQWLFWSVASSKWPLLPRFGCGIGFLTFPPGFEGLACTSEHGW